MAFIREKKQDGRSYFYLVRNFRGEDGKTRQQHIRYLGTRRPRGRQKGLKG
ncbi:hypothetical protein ES703_27217 [subsurface metagenome]